ncbi:hypothetical protein M0R89_14600 [Halorussus limi]|uniref:Uncharacterized protein n=1 Tax=Halorussus limi TaxID=2938695 RepID=A0A8U0HSN2_9EURY|nr:hypothetical protein [Halorussus limi]UPV73763.1 hypothetical protein M0R89_14600 [Halorussus limi]
MFTRLPGWLRSRDSSDGDDGTVWDAIPSRQYGGRHAESGGVTREQQERALGEVQRRAEELDDQH